MSRFITLAILLFIGSAFSLKSSYEDIGFKDIQIGPKLKNTFNIKTNKDHTQLQVVDYKNSGGVFEIFDNGVSLGRTSTPSPGGETASTPEEALIKGGFSKRIFDLLETSDHKITIKAINPSNEGMVSVRLLDSKDHVFPDMIKRGWFEEEEEEEEDCDDQDNYEEEEEEEDCDDQDYYEEEEEQEKEDCDDQDHYEEEEEDYDDDGSYNENNYGSWKGKKQYNKEDEGNWDNGNKGDEEDELEGCDTDVDTGRTVTLLETVYEDTPVRSIGYITIGLGQLGNSDSFQYGENDVGYIYRTPIAQDTW